MTSIFIALTLLVLKMFVCQLAILLLLHILFLCLRVEQKPSKILKRFLDIDIFLSTDVVYLLDVIIFGKLVHSLLLYLPLDRVYFIAEDEDIAMRSIVVLQLLVPIRAEVLYYCMDTS